MGVFLRWGIFGILAVAGLMYAYNASKQMAQRRVAAPPPVAAAPPEEADPMSANCRVELDIARRALEMRSIGEPLDRLLRIQEIAWQEDAKRRERLTQVATRWYARTGPVDAAQLRQAVLADCENP